MTDDPKKHWKVLSSESVFKNKWIKLRRDCVKLPSGVVIKDFIVSELPDVSQIFAVTKDYHVIFVKQYRHAIGKVVLELPAGTLDKKRENPLEAARRELLEETGYKANKIISLGAIQGFPTKDTYKINLYLALDVEFKETTFQDKTEDIEVIKVPISKCLDLIESREIVVAGTIVGIVYAMNYLKNKSH